MKEVGVPCECCSLLSRDDDEAVLALDVGAAGVCVTPCFGSLFDFGSVLELSFL